MPHSKTDFIKFLSKTNNSKIIEVKKRGLYIDQYLTPTHKLKLFILDNFFVELTVNTSTNLITQVEAFKDAKELSSYFQNIELPQLV